MSSGNVWRAPATATGVVVLADQLVKGSFLGVGLAAAAAHGTSPAHNAGAHCVRRVEAAPAHPEPGPPAWPHAQAHELVVV